MVNYAQIANAAKKNSIAVRKAELERRMTIISNDIIKRLPKIVQKASNNGKDFAIVTTRTTLKKRWYIPLQILTLGNFNRIYNFLVFAQWVSPRLNGLGGYFKEVTNFHFSPSGNQLRIEW